VTSRIKNQPEQQRELVLAAAALPLYSDMPHFTFFMFFSLRCAFALRCLAVAVEENATRTTPVPTRGGSLPRRRRRGHPIQSRGIQASLLGIGGYVHEMGYYSTEAIRRPLRGGPRSVWEASVSRRLKLARWGQGTWRHHSSLTGCGR
jgi:hypothetical protein